MSQTNSTTAKKPPLPETLAKRVQHLRGVRDMTVRQLAQQTALPVQMIEDIEAGLELFLSPAVRQRLARILRVKADVLEEVESKPEKESTLTELKQQQRIKQKSLLLVNQIKTGITENLTCPECEKDMIVQIYPREDLEGNKFEVIKAHCSSCLFRLETD